MPGSYSQASSLLKEMHVILFKSNLDLNRYPYIATCGKEVKKLPSGL